MSGDRLIDALQRGLAGRVCSTVMIPADVADELLGILAGARELPAPKRAPVQGLPGGIPWHVHLEAYAAYCREHRPQPALIEGECRGGFGIEELDAFVPGWRDRLNETPAQLAELQRLRDLARACYVGLVAECDLPETWADAFLAALSGKPFTVDGLIPFERAKPAAEVDAEELWRRWCAGDPSAGEEAIRALRVDPCADVREVAGHG